MPKGLKRFHSGGDEHFITSSCYRRQPFLASARRRDLFLNLLEEVRQKYQFVVWGYVVMPEHFHLLISEPTKRNVAVAMQVLKQRVSRRCRRKKKITGQTVLGRLSCRLRSGSHDPTTSTCSPSANTPRS